MKKILTVVNSIHSVLVINQLIKPNQQILIGISAGQDSSALLFFFFILQKQWNIKIYLLYCNHLWQKESFYTFLHLSKISFTLELNFSYNIAINMPVSEQTARNWRFKNFLRFNTFLNSQNLLTGHTESDLIETFLFNLIRGSGSSGISSLKLKKTLTKFQKNDFLISKKKLFKFPILKKKKSQNTIFFHNNLRKKKKKKSFNTLQNKCLKIKFRQKKTYSLTKIKLNQLFIIRPLLNKSRVDIQRICNNWKLPVFPDQTNEKFIYRRNRIRKQLLPSLRFFFNPKIDLILSRSNQIIIAEEFVIENLLKQLFTEIIFEHKTFYSMNLALFFPLPLGIKRKICFLLLTKKLKIDSNFYLINLVVSLINEKFFQLKTTQTKKTQNEMKSCNWVFLPQIGILFFYKKIIIIFK